MKKRTVLLLFAASLCLRAVPAGASEPPPPILIGPGKDDVSPRILRDLRALARAVTGTLEEPWLLDCFMCTVGDTHELYRAEVYLTPRVHTSRLVRGRSLTCVTPQTNNSWNPASPVVNDWACADRQPGQYAIVAPPDHPFAADGPFEGAFNIVGRMNDEDVVAVAEAMRQVAPEQKIVQLSVLESGGVRAMGYGTRPLPDLEIDFQKTGGVWTETKRNRWSY